MNTLLTQPLPDCRALGSFPRTVREDGPIQILYADDDAMIRRVAEMLLSRFGYAVTTAADGEEALALLGCREHDLLITDFHMPRRNGLELLHELRKADILLPAILASGTLGEIPSMDPLQLGCVAMIAKPFSADELNSAVRVALSSTCRRWPPAARPQCCYRPCEHSLTGSQWEI